MPVDVSPSRKVLEGNPGATALVQALDQNEANWGLERAAVYVDFPVYRDPEGSLVTPQLLLVSPNHGVAIFGLTASARPLAGEIDSLTDRVDGELQHLYGRLLASRVLPKARTALQISVSAAIFAPNLSVNVQEQETPILKNAAQLGAFLQSVVSEPLTPEFLSEIEALIQGTKGLRSPKKREVADLKPTSKGALASQLEAEIATLDQQQRHGTIVSIRGAQRIRGIAGSGKTVVLAMKASLAQVQHDDARILYTFHTRSLYQHIRYLITRAYRNRDYHDPNWDTLNVLHSWGGRAAPGVYYDACVRAGVRPLTFTEANAATSTEDAFEYACATLLESGRVTPYYDFTFVDEGQDFSPAYLQLCAALTKDERLVVAYDELQTIFRPNAPTAAEMFGSDADGNPNIEFEEDVVLHKCYRNPRQILVCAHAIGLGIYGPRIAQMPENEAHWQDLGYEVVDGSMTAGNAVRIHRPEQNSPNTISRTESITESIKAVAYDNIDEEIEYIISSIKNDLADGMRPDDIMMVVLDDRYAQAYISRARTGLSTHGIRSHDVHSMRTATGDFFIDGHITLTTIHKAKGNEAYMVYLAGIDAAWGR